MPESLRERIKRHERLRLEPYRDSLGNWTVGYGHRLLISITGVRAELLLTDDLERAEQAAQIVVGDVVCDVRVHDVLVEMCFQLGENGVRGFTKMLAAVRAADYETAADEMLESAWARQTPERAQELATIMRTGTERTRGEGQEI